MQNMIKKMIQYPRVTQDYPNEPLDTKLMIGRPEVRISSCTSCGQCLPRCPSGAIAMDTDSGKIVIHYDLCVYCTLCEEVCPAQAIRMTDRIEFSERDKNKLRSQPLILTESHIQGLNAQDISHQLTASIQKAFGRSLQIREVDAGSCNGCDYEIDALNNPFNDIERLGIHFVASPRHADMLLVTGIASRNMQLALLKTYQATPDPKLVVAVGACACSGGIFRDSYASGNGIDQFLPVDIYIPGCPPRPQAIIYGILKALDRIK